MFSESNLFNVNGVQIQIEIFISSKSCCNSRLTTNILITFQNQEQNILFTLLYYLHYMVTLPFSLHNVKNLPITLHNPYIF